jgi:hypothetical protein
MKRNISLVALLESRKCGIKTYILILLCSSMFFACKHIETVELMESALYTINLDSIPTVDNFRMSSTFRKAKAIRLEETDYAVIGEINSMQVFDNYIFILDIDKAKKLFMFDKNGKYLRQIGRLGQGPGEYLYISDFCLDTINREIYILDSSKKMLYKYNFDSGKFIGSINMQYTEGHYPYYVTLFNNKIYTNIVRHENLLMELELETNIQKEFLNADKYNCGWNRPYYTPYNFFISKLDSPKFVEHLMPTVMSIEKTKIYPYLTVKSENWVKKTDIWSEEKLKEERTSQYMLLRQKGRVFNIQNYREYGDYIYFEYNKGGNIYLVVFNKATKEAYQCNCRESFENDLFCKSGIKGHNQAFIFEAHNTVYSVFNPVYNKYYKLTENDIAPNLENRETVIEAINQDEECFIILEYEFK